MNKTRVLKICSDLDKILKQYGNINFLNKEDLYTLIDFIRISFRINDNRTFNILEFLKNFDGIVVRDSYKFNDQKIGGLLIKNKYPEKSFIIVNSSKEPISTIFDLTHEIVHFLLHPENRKNYISTTLCDLDNFEWQANEGAAELLVPYKHFIPLFAKNIKQCHSKSEYLEFINYLSGVYTVSSSVLEYRISGLKYEIKQFENGVPLNKLVFLSKRAQEKQGIFIKSYNSIFKRTPTSLKSILAPYYSI